MFDPVLLTPLWESSLVFSTVDRVVGLDVKAAVKSEDPHVCSRTLNWVMYCIDSSNKAVILNVHKDNIQICLEFLNDGTAQVRDAAFLVLVAIAKSVGKELLNVPLENLDDVRRKKLSEMIGVLRRW
ncbi:hypothetical protein CTI12_AA419380 [Artemisia annua]|uniref:Armadillo-like helical n=1 Tax=Artemisia annua TaxID=35608 RepID=A0A2U1M538_ARTAN|nr:hypothetical protein CTI12_AA419380 [Artemisia annua]